MKKSIKHIVCYSGGHSSGLVAIEVTRRYGKDNVILLNHDINSDYEDKDIKRFKTEVSCYLDVPITFANINGINNPDNLPNQFEVCEDAGSFVNVSTRQALCTNRLKTSPFIEYLDSEFPNKNAIIYYGFDKNEPNRIERRKDILTDMGFYSDYPLSLWEVEGIENYNKFLLDKAIKYSKKLDPNKEYKDYVDFYIKNPEVANILGLISYKKTYKRTIFSTNEINIKPPNVYNKFKHANCIGCLKAGKQHWYVVYCTRPDVFERAKESEGKIGYSIIKGSFLKDIENDFEKMRMAGISPTEHIKSQSFWAKARKITKFTNEELKPCECMT